jgi:N6-adenosine-specific RNA methylase IME4
MTIKRSSTFIRPIEIGGFALGEHGAKPVSPKVGITKDGWLAAASFAKATEIAAPYWVGDLLCWLEENSGWDEHTIEQLTATTGFARQTLYNAKSIASRVSIEARELAPSFSHARAVASLPASDQKKILRQATEEELTASQTAKRAKRLSRPTIVEGQATLKGKYRVIYADPPWSYKNNTPWADGSNTPAENSYEGMSIEEICALPIEQHAMKDAVLFMWSTNSHLLQNPGARDVIEAWGFEYRTNYVWDKVLGRPGHYSYPHHELLTVSVRGRCVPDVDILKHDHASIFQERREGDHSHKPRFARRLIEKLYTTGPKLELFAREQNRGWTPFGNDARLWVKEA